MFVPELALRQLLGLPLEHQLLLLLLLEQPTTAPTTRAPTTATPTTRAPTTATPTTRVPTTLPPLRPPSDGPAAPEACSSLLVGFSVSATYSTSKTLRWVLAPVSGAPIVTAIKLSITPSEPVTFSVSNLNPAGTNVWDVNIPSANGGTQLLSSLQVEVNISPKTAVQWTLFNIVTANGPCLASGNPAAYEGTVPA
eukprot:TRINITY_DN444_c0_g1_i1.p1 TRINITY_DN444_c0_g1~~TRINITY_DN444_c0_g1_i1.p1  ORF type:complete len:196 (-),score=51.61 TRINITY_DN444_c0_g1_i1:51-638(-)